MRSIVVIGQASGGQSVQPAGNTRLARNPRARISVAGMLLVGTLALATGCAAGQRAQTSSVVSVIGGVNAHSETVSVSNIAVTAPISGSYSVGEQASLQMVVVNEGKTRNSLTSITTSAAKSVVLSPTLAAATSTAISASATPTASASATASSTASAGTPIPLPVGTAVRIGLPGSAASAILQDLTTALFPAQSLTVTLTFSDGQTITSPITVLLGDNAGTAPTLALTPEGE